MILKNKDYNIVNLEVTGHQVLVGVTTIKVLLAFAELKIEQNPRIS